MSETPTIGIIAPPALGLVTRRASDITPQEIRWLWPQRIALGKLSLIAGDPGLGKSLLSLRIAAIVSRGGLWPVDQTQSPPGSVLIVSAEDGADDTIVPRLAAAGADLSKIHILDHVRVLGADGKPLDRELSLESDIAWVEKTIADLDDCRLVIVDPISAYLGKVDSHRNTEVRAVLGPLAKLAGRLDVAIQAVSHLNKSAGDSAAYRVVGSIAFSAAVRGSLLVVKDRDDPCGGWCCPARTILAAMIWADSPIASKPTWLAVRIWNSNRTQW